MNIHVNIVMIPGGIVLGRSSPFPRAVCEISCACVLPLSHGTQDGGHSCSGVLGVL